MSRFMSSRRFGRAVHGSFSRVCIIFISYVGSRAGKGEICSVILRDAASRTGGSTVLTLASLEFGARRPSRVPVNYARFGVA